MYRHAWLIAFVLCCLLVSQRVSASHSAGGELYYEWVSDSTYKIIYKLYRDCAGVEVAEEARVCYTNECDFYRDYVMLPLKNPIGVELYPGCPGYPTKCSDYNSPYPGYQEYIYEGYVTLPSRCRKWTFFVNEVARNKNIGNLVNAITTIPPNHPMYLEATLNNEVAQGNSSPWFSVRPVPYVCVNEPYTYNNGAVDKDGDFLVFDHVQPTWGLFSMGTPACFFANPIPIPYCCGYAMPDNPFATNFTYRLDPFSGHISFTPHQIQTAVVTLRVREYRNGVEVGSVLRDIQLVIIPCNSPSIVTDLDTAGMQGSLIANNRVEGCVETPMEVCIDFKVPGDPNAKLAVSDNHGVALPAASITYIHLNSDSVRACVQWTPGANDTGRHLVVFLMKDSACRPPGTLLTSAYTLPIYINPETRAFGSGDLCAGDSVRLRVTGWVPFTWDALPGGSPVSSLSCTTCTDPWAKPGLTTQYIATANNRICCRHTDTVTVTVRPSPDIMASPDTITCVDNDLQLNVDINRLPGENYTIEWSPAATLSSPSVPNPVARPNGDITYRVKVTSRSAGCVSYDSVKVAVLRGFTLHNGDTAICAGDAVQVRLTGDPRYRYVWRPADGVSDTLVLEPLIRPDTPTRYTVTASYPVCRDSAASFFIDVQPVPVVVLPSDTILCRNDTLRIISSVTPPYAAYSYSWTPAGGLTPDGTVPTPLFTAAQTTNLVLQVQTPAGCSGTDEMRIEVAGVTRVQADTGICPGDTIMLFVEGNREGQVWRPGRWISDTLSAAPQVYPLETITYTVYAFDIMNCKDTQTVRVEVYPEAVIHLPDTLTVYAGAVQHLDPAGNCLYFEWFPEEGLSDPRTSHPQVAPDRDMRYVVTGTTEHGCIAIDTIDVLVTDALIDMPNAFVPGSSVNGKLRPVYRGGVTLKRFQIFNRWGEQVFSTKDISDGWDGTLKGRPQPVGVYVYIVEAATPGGRIFYKQGNVSLLR